jgi:integrase
VFCTLQGGRMDSSYVRRLLPRLARKAGVARRVHAHGLRQTYAAELARERTPINVIRDALGHSTLAVTDRHPRDVAPMHVIDTVRGRTWESV